MGSLRSTCTDRSATDLVAAGDASPSLGRRDAMRALAGAAVAGGSLAATGPASAQDEPDYGDWFDDVSNYDGTVDRTGQDTVTVTVGAEGNGGAFAYDPAAVMVSPGTTVQWEWTGEGGGHNVVSPEDGPLDSGDPVDTEGVEYEHTFEETGVYRYVCTPHESLGMKGAVAVQEGSASGDGGGGDGGGGDGGGDDGSGGGGSDAGGGPAVETGLGIATGAVLLAFFSPVLFAAFLRRRARGRRTGE